MMDAEAHDRHAFMRLWASDARGRSAARKTHAAAAARTAGVLSEQADRAIERLAEVNPQSASRLLTIRVVAARQRTVIAEQRRCQAAGRADRQPPGRPRRPGAALVAELDAHARDEIAICERDRIAAELHETVIRRVFAAGLALQSAAGITAQPEVRTRVEAAADDLDEVIRIIRDTIFRPASGGT